MAECGRVANALLTCHTQSMPGYEVFCRLLCKRDTGCAGWPLLQEWTAGPAQAQKAHAESVASQMSFSAQHWEGLLAILACSDSALRQVVQRWPGIAELTVGDVMHRLLCLKVSL